MRVPRQRRRRTSVARASARRAVVVAGVVAEAVAVPALGALADATTVPPPPLSPLAALLARRGASTRRPPPAKVPRHISHQPPIWAGVWQAAGLSQMAGDQFQGKENAKAVLRNRWTVDPHGARVVRLGHPRPFTTPVRAPSVARQAGASGGRGPPAPAPKRLPH